MAFRIPRIIRDIIGLADGTGTTDVSAATARTSLTIGTPIPATPSTAPTIGNLPVPPSGPAVAYAAGGGFSFTTVQWFYILYDPNTGQSSDFVAGDTVDFSAVEGVGQISGIPALSTDAGSMRLWLVRLDANVGSPVLVADVTGQSDYTDDGSGFYDYWYGAYSVDFTYAVGFTDGSAYSAVGPQVTGSGYYAAPRVLTGLPTPPAGQTAHVLIYDAWSTNQWYVLGDATDPFYDGTIEVYSYSSLTPWIPSSAPQTITPATPAVQTIFGTPPDATGNVVPPINVNGHYADAGGSIAITTGASIPTAPAGTVLVANGSGGVKVYSNGSYSGPWGFIDSKVCLGGVDNAGAGTANGTVSIGGKYHGTPVGNYSALVGGYSNDVNGAEAGTYVGHYSAAHAPNATCIGGRSGIAIVQSQSVIGAGSWIAGEAYNDDAQISRYVFTASSVSGAAAMASAGIGGSAVNQRLQVPTSRAIAATMNIVARCASTGDMARWLYSVLVHNEAGVLTLTDTHLIYTAASAGASAWAITFSVDQTNKTMDTTCTGASGQTVHFVADVSAAQVG